MDHTKRLPSLPVDRGWAWLVMLGAFFNTLFNFMFLRSLSIFFIEFLDTFQQSATITTLAFGLNTAAFILGALLLPPVFLSRFTVRFVTLLGSFITVAAIIGLAFSPNMICLTAMFVFIGFAHPFIFVSQIALLGVYFKKRLSFAVAFANLGLSGGLMIGPYLTRILLNNYGLTGSLLIHAGLNLNLIPSCMLFRPASLYANESSPNDLENTDSSDVDEREENTAIESLELTRAVDVRETKSLDPKNKITKTIDNHSEDIDFRKSILTQDSNSNLSRLDSVNFGRPRVKDLHENESGDASISESQQSLDDERRATRNSQNSLTFVRNGKPRHRTTSEVCISKRGKTQHHTTSEMCIQSVHLSKSSLAGKASLAHSVSRASKSILDFMSSSGSVQYLSNSTLYLSNIFKSLSPSQNGPAAINVSRQFSETHSQTSKMISIEICDNALIASQDCYDDTSQFYDGSSNQKCCSCFRSSSPPSNTERGKSVFSNPLGVMLLLLAGIGVNTQCGAAYMPSLGKDQGVDTDQLPILMTVVGAVDLCKLFTGYVADKGFVRRIHLVLVCQLIVGISFQFASLFQGFAGMVILCVIFGANTGVLHILLPGITVDLLGPEYIGQVMSGYFLINGANMTLCHILIGFLKDTTGSFARGYNLLGCFQLFGALIVLMEPIFRRLAKRTSRS